MDFTISYQPTPDEVARALVEGMQRQLRAFRLLLPAVLVVGGFGCLLVDALGLGIGMFVAAVVSPFVMTWSTRRIAKRQFAHLCVPTTLTFTSEGYEYRTAQSTVSMRWSLLGKVVTTPEFWLMFVNGLCTGFLPRRAFDSEQQAALDALFAERYNAVAP